MIKNIIFLGLAFVASLKFSLGKDDVPERSRCSWVSTCSIDSFYFRCSNDRYIDREFYCDGKNDCGDNSDEVFCDTEYNCPNSPAMRKCPDTRRCIRNGWFCDGRQDCPNGRDEVSCQYDEKKVKCSSEARALYWLRNNKKKSQSATETWGSDVDKSAVALYLASDISAYKAGETRKEMPYEVSIQLLSRLSQRKLQDIPSSDLASYVNAFLVTCLDPRKFHGLNIVQELRRRVDSQNHTNPYLLLSLCNAGDIITESDKMKLIDTFWSKRRAFWTDMQAVTVMALACASKQPGNGVDSETLTELALELKQHQSRNGSVENLQTTALVMQALLSAEPEADPDNFDENKALQTIFAMQKQDGSFGSFMNTYYVLPVLNCMSLVNINSAHCESSSQSETSTLEDLTNRSGPKVHVRYSLWIGNEKDLERHLTLQVPANLSFYGAMEMAAEIDSRYRFEYVVKNRKPYVNALSGLQDNPERGKFWFLYTIVEGKPTPSQESPADVKPKDNEHFVMWYRSGSWID